MNTTATAKTTETPAERYEAARANVRRVEEEGRSASTVNRAYRELFAAEDALKASGLGW